ncbi:acyltransferase [Cetobacterium somerae]|uniref:acyltransferase n=1 Tax=Cetobacterium somerae TaxID=188913 RepID=UPI0022519733|nr:acyltransferase [Cetobacterium somerae]MCX3067007.1 acyltransferase [Cetobacterium somerae]
MSFYTREELKKIGFKSLGTNVLISDKCSIYSPEKIEIGNNVRIDDFSILSGDIKIGNYVHIAAFSALFGGAGIIMEDFTGISSRVTIYSVSDDYSGEYLTNPTVPNKYKKVQSEQVILKKHSLVGASSIILPGVTLGVGTSIGANSLVTKSTEDWTIYFGSPIKKLKLRKQELLKLEEELLEEEKNV